MITKLKVDRNYNVDHYIQHNSLLLSEFPPQFITQDSDCYDIIKNIKLLLIYHIISKYD